MSRSLPMGAMLLAVATAVAAVASIAMLGQSLQLWLGAAAIAVTPMLLVWSFVPEQRMRHGLRRRSLPQATIVARLSETTARLLERKLVNTAIDRRLELASLSLRSGEFVVLTTLASAVPAAILGFLGMKSSALTVLVGVPTFAWVAVSRRGRRRAERFREQLGETIMMIAGSMRSGSSSSQALARVAEKAPSPTAEEFQRVVAETRIGRDAVVALRDLATRMGSEDAHWLVEAVALNRELGGNLASTLDGVAATMQARAEIQSQVQVMSAEGRLTAGLLLALPFVVAAYLQWSNPGYLSPLFDTSAGNLLLAIALGLMGVGAFWVSRLIKMEY